MKRLGLFVAIVSFALLLPRVGLSQAKVQRSVSNETVEKILTGLELKFQKLENKGKEGPPLTHFDFKRGDLPCRLTNYGTDLWIEWQFDKKLKPEEANRWNAQAKFSRVVLIDNKDKGQTSLEAQLDCLGGVTEPMIRQFINRFDEEAKKFAKSLPK